MRTPIYNGQFYLRKLLGVPSHIFSYIVNPSLWTLFICVMSMTEYLTSENLAETYDLSNVRALCS